MMAHSFPAPLGADVMWLLVFILLPLSTNLAASGGAGLCVHHPPWLSTGGSGVPSTAKDPVSTLMVLRCFCSAGQLLSPIFCLVSAWS